MKTTFPFDTPTFIKQINKHQKKFPERKFRPLTKTMIWSWWVHTDGGKRWNEFFFEPACFFYTDPPIPESMIYRSNSSIATVLVVGTSSQISMFAFGNPLVPDSQLAKVYRLCLDHHLKETKLLWSSEAGNFWESFFDQKDFFGQPTLYPPRLIITTGQIRNHDSQGAGETRDCLERLQEIGKKWKIPVEKILVPRGY